MTNPPQPEQAMTWPFPTPGPILATAYQDIYLAAEGNNTQKQLIGDPNLLPKPWDPPTCRNPQLRAALWVWLEQVVTWINHEYTWDPENLIPPCWPQHPHLVHEIAVLADQRRRAGIALDSNTLEEWHRYTLPSFQDRMKTRLKTHCDQHHQPWPAKPRHTRHTNHQHHQTRQNTYNQDLQTIQPPPHNPHTPPTHTTQTRSHQRGRRRY